MPAGAEVWLTSPDKVAAKVEVGAAAFSEMLEHAAKATAPRVSAASTGASEDVFGIKTEYCLTRSNA